MSRGEQLFSDKNFLQSTKINTRYGSIFSLVAKAMILRISQPISHQESKSSRIKTSDQAFDREKHYVKLYKNLYTTYIL